MDDDDEETLLLRGGVYIKCPICFDKKRVEEGVSLLLSCCGQSICETCLTSHYDMCDSKSLEGTCPFCRSEKCTNKKVKGLLIKHS